MKTMLKKILFIWLFFSAKVELLSANSFMSAVISNNIKKVRQALANGINIDEQDKAGCTALWYAAFFGRSEIVELLLAGGAEVNKKNKHSGSTALGGVAWREKFTKIEEQKKYRNIIGRLLVAGADQWIKCEITGKLKQVDLSKYLQDMQKKTPEILMKELSSQLLLKLPKVLAVKIAGLAYQS